MRPDLKAAATPEVGKSIQPGIPPTPKVTEADRAWAREQIAKAPMPQDLVDYINELRRAAAVTNASAGRSVVGP